MLDIYKRIEKLMSNGCDRGTAALIEWELSDKESLSFKEFKEFYELLSSNSPRRPEVIGFIKKKAETFEELKWIWEALEMKSEQEAEIFKLMKKKAETLEELQFLWKETIKSSDQCELWGRMVEKAKELR